MRLRKNKEVAFNEWLHVYTAGDGHTLIGVTELMKRHGLSPDYGGISKDVLEKAAARGTAIHQLLQDYDDGKTVIEDENLKAYKALGLKVHCSEYLVSDNEIVATFIDKVLDDCSLADVKSTSTVHRRPLEWQLSIGAYLFELQNPGKKVPHLYCIHVRDAKAKQIEVSRIPNDAVERLLECERCGVVYSDNPVAADAALALEEQAVVLAEQLDQIARLKLAIKETEQASAELQQRLYDYMTENNLDEMACELGTFVRKAPYTKKALDSARLKKEKPELYEQYLKESEVKGSITFKTN